jgi:Fe-S-cluster containining protein
MPDLMTKSGFPYVFDPTACETCEGRCCTGESGNIFISSKELAAITAYLKLDIEVFKEQYLVKRDYRYSIREKLVGLSHDCIFFDRAQNGCRIYAVRPSQCITFPFWDYYKERVDELKRECPGVSDV